MTALDPRWHITPLPVENPFERMHISGSNQIVTNVLNTRRWPQNKKFVQSCQVWANESIDQMDDVNELN